MCQACVVAESARLWSRRDAFRLFAAGAASMALSGSAIAKEAKAPPKPENVLSPDAALQRLIAGNRRYVAGLSKRHDFKHEREPLTKGQNPFASILSCADSRIAPELAFDTARGDVFVCRVAGNFVNDDILASFEYGVAVLSSPLIMVLGHDSCGAISSTIKSLADGTVLPGHLPALVTALTSAVTASKDQPGDPMDNAVRQNVVQTVKQLQSASPILTAAIEQSKLKIIGAIYRLNDGHVEIVA